MTAMMILTANSMHDPKHNNLFSDSHLVENGLQIVDKMAKKTGNDMLHSFQATCTELHKHMQRKCVEAGSIANDRERSSYLILRT